MPYQQGHYNIPRFIGKNYAVTADLRCIRVFIPDGDEYVQQIMTLINVAATRAAWWTDTDEQRKNRVEMWQRAYEETLSVIGDGCMDCSWILECLEDPDFVDAMDGLIASLLDNPASATRAAVVNITQQQISNSQGYPLSEETRNLALNQGADVCDEDSLWGSCLHTVVVLNRLNLDFLETMEAASENQEILAGFVASVPVIETLPIDEIIAFADNVRAFVAEFYAAGYDVDLESEFACELFCLAMDNDCKLTMDIITDYFWNRAELLPGWSNAFEGALTIISALANWQEMTGEAVVVAMMAANVGFMHWLNSALGLDFGRFQLQTRAGIPDDDWQLCACVNTWVHEFDFSTSDGGFVLYPQMDGMTPVDFGVYASGDAWQGQYKTFNSPSTLGCVAIQVDIPVSTHITEIKIVWSGTVTTIQGTVTDGVIVGSTTLYSEVPSAKGTSGSMAERQVYAGDHAVSAGDDLKIRWVYRRTFSNTANSGSIEINKVILSGTGGNPFA
jgi:hypothetical protein